MKSIGRFLLLSLMICSVLSVNACSMFGSSNETLNVVTSERDADIYINGIYRGKGVAQALVPRNQNASILVKKDGFYPTERSVGITFSGLGILDIFGGVCLLLPFIGLAFPASRSLEQNNVSIVMEPV